MFDLPFCIAVGFIIVALPAVLQMSHLLALEIYNPSSRQLRAQILCLAIILMLAWIASVIYVLARLLGHVAQASPCMIVRRLLVNDTLGKGKFEYDNGEWHAATLGHFVSLLIDAGADPAVLFRVTGDGPSDESGNFIRHLEIVMLPEEHIIEQCRAYGITHTHKTLAALIEAGVVT